MLGRRRFLLLVAGLFLLITPALAAERVASLPQVTPVSSGRLDYVLAINKTPLEYGQARYTGDRIHAVFVDATNNQRLEVIIIGDVIYVLLPGETRWVSARLEQVEEEVPVSSPMPAAPPAGREIYLVGDVDVNGNPTEQYQVPLTAAEINDPGENLFTSGAVDYFIGKQNRHIWKDQLSLRGRDPQIGDILGELVVVQSALNTPISVEPPPANLVDQLSERAFTKRYLSAGGRAVPVWARAGLTHALQRLRSAK